VKKNTTKKYITPRERDVMARLLYEKVDVITQDEFDSFFKYPPEERNKLIYNLKRKNILLPIKRGVYYFVPLEVGTRGISINEFLVASVLLPEDDYYVGYSTMYNIYGFTEQIFQVMYILNTVVKIEKVISNVTFKMVKVNQERLYGLTEMEIPFKDRKVRVSDRERTLVDLIYFSKPVGGLVPAYRILEEQVKSGAVDVKKFVRYAQRFPNIATRKRIGFILETRCNVEESALASLRKSIAKSSLWQLYERKSRKGKINDKWKIIENVAS
jgi:predicted transcriptional regulator of viral defense system